VLTVVLLAGALSDRRDFATAEAVLRRALARRPQELVLLNAQAKMMEKRRPIPYGAVIEYYRAMRAQDSRLGLALGMALDKVGRTAEGEEVLQDLVRQRRANPELLFYLGYLLHEQQKLSEAVAAYREVIRLDPTFHKAYNDLGCTLREQKKLPEAVAACQEAIRLKADFPYAYHNLGNALYDQQKIPEAITAYQQAIRYQPDFSQAHFNLGLVLHEQKQLRKAVAAFREAIRHRPDFYPAQQHLGLALHQQKKLDAAIAAYSEAIRLKPDDYLSHYNRGLALEEQRKLAEAVAAYFETIRLRPRFAPAHNALGNVLAQQKKFPEAVAACQAAIRLDPGLHLAHYNLGNALREQKKLPEAAAAYQETIRLKPDYARAHINLAAVYRMQGEFVLSLAAMRRGHELGAQTPGWSYPTASWVRNARRRVELDHKLPALLKGEARPRNVAEQIELAELCSMKRWYATSARFYAKAFAADPALAEDPGATRRYYAACSAVLAGCDEGKDPGRLDEKERSRLRGQALDWLRSDLQRWSKALEQGKGGAAAVRQQMQHWQNDDELGSVRDRAALAKLPWEERTGWLLFWADVDALLLRAETK
jgi:tetratricopeptide (TPR) repeat protein